MKAAKSPELISYMVNRPAQGMFPDSKLASQVVVIDEPHCYSHRRSDLSNHRE